MRIVHRIARIVSTALLVLVLLMSGAVVATQTIWFKNWLRRYVVREAEDHLNSQLSIGRVGGNLFSGVELVDVVLSTNGRATISAKDIQLRYSALTIIRRGLDIQSLRIDEPVVHLARQGDTWSIAQLVKTDPQAINPGPSTLSISVGRIDVSNGSVVFDDEMAVPGLVIPRRIDHVDARLGFTYAPSGYGADITHASFQASEPSFTLNELTGRVTAQQDDIHVDKLVLRTRQSSLAADGVVQHSSTNPSLKLHATADKVSLQEFSAIVPALAGRAAINIQPQLDVRLDGPLDHLGAGIDMRSSAGEVNAQFVAGILPSGQSIRGTLSTRNLDAAPFINDPAFKSDITATITADVHGAALSNPASLDGSIAIESKLAAVAGYEVRNLRATATLNDGHARWSGSTTAYGANASIDGTLAFSPQLEARAYEATGHVGSVDLSRMPSALGAPAAATNINAFYRLKGHGLSALRIDARFQPSDIPGAHIAAPSTIEVAMQHAGGAWRMAEYQADVVASRVDVQRVGEAFAIPALATDTYKSDIDTVVQVSGHGTSLKTMDANIHGRLTNAALFGGHLPSVVLDATIASDTASVNVNGSAAGIDPAAASGRPQLKGEVAGTFHAVAQIANLSGGFRLDRMQGTANVALGPSNVAGLQIDCADLNTSFGHQILNVQTLDVTGPDLRVQGRGVVGLTPSADSNLHLHAESVNLPAIGKMIDAPLEGVATVDATVTGNQSQLKVSGTFAGNDLAYAGGGAVVASSDYAIELPNLQMTDAAITATSKATFVTIGGEHINELAAQTRYEHKQLDVDVTATQPRRSVAATGSVLFRPDAEELRMTRLNLTAQNIQWQLPPGTEASVQYGGGVSVQGLRLVAGNQQISADGTFGKPGDPLKVTLTNVDLAGVDALLLRPSQFSGVLNGTATVSGTSAAPRVEADFEVANGGFRQFRYQAFKGTVRYNGVGATIDSRLDESATNWIHVSGYAPESLVRASAGPQPAGDAAGDRVDLHVESSNIDLGLVQGFTTALTNVKGSVQARVDVTGSGASPQADGSISLADASFMVAPTGVTYAHMNGEIQLQHDRLHIANLNVLDGSNASLSITGDLPIRETPTADVQLRIAAKDFRVINNEMGNARINSDLMIAGELRAPRVSGTLAVSSGTIKLDPVLAMAGESPYAIAPTEYDVVRTTAAADATFSETPPATGNMPAAGNTADATPAGPHIFDAVEMDVHVAVPDDLIVQSTSLRAPGAPISLGAVNMTLGGDLHVTKERGRQSRITGTVNTVRGTYEFQGRQFTLLRDGNVRFEGTRELNPALNLKTQRVIQGVQANVNIVGTLLQPRIELSSIPPLDQSDILSLIVFNQPINELGEGQQISLGQRAEQLAVGAIAGELSKSLGNLLNVSEFRIDASPDSGAAVQLTVGQQISPNVYVKLEEGMGDISTTNFILEYELTNWLRLQTNLLQGSTSQQVIFQSVQDSGVDLIFVFTY